MFNTKYSLRLINGGRVRLVLGLGLGCAVLVKLPLRAGEMPGRTEEPLQLAPLKVVSTATRTQRLISQVPIRTEVLPREDIGLRASANFSQAIELMNGVRVESNCQNCNTAEVQLLGLGGSYNQILFDGMPLLSALGGVYGIEQIPAAFVDRFEVVKGGGSALYGPGAVAGVINLVPVEPHVAGGFVQTSVEWSRGRPFWFADARVNAVLPGNRGGVAAVGQGSRNGAVDFNGDGFSEITAKSQAVAGFQGWWALTPQTKLRANYQYTQEDRRGGNRFEQPAFLANIAESLQTSYHRGGVRWDQLVGSNFDFQVGYAFAYIERDSFYGGLGDVVTDPTDPAYNARELDPRVAGSAAARSFNQYGYTENPLHYFDSQFNYRVGGHAFAFGVQHKRESVFDENRNFLGAAVRPGVREKFSNTGIFLQDEWTVAPAWDVVWGGRIDRSSSLGDPIFSPRVAVAFDVGDGWKIRPGVSTGFRAPEIFSEDLHVDTLGAAPVGIRSGNELKEESAVTTMLGFEWRNHPQRPRWGFDLTGSVTELRNTFVLGEIRVAADGQLFRERTNAAGARVGGLEANLVYQPSQLLRINAGVSYYRSRYTEAEEIFDDTAEGGSTVIATRDYLKTPRWGGILQAVWTPHGSTSAYLGLKYTGPMDALNNTTRSLNRTADFWVADWGLTRHFELRNGRHVDLGLGVKNMFDARQSDLETGVHRDSTYVYGPRFARAFHATIKYEF